VKIAWSIAGDGELDKAAVSAKFAHTAPDGKKYQTLSVSSLQ